MACKIEIKKTILKSIEEEIVDSKSIYSKIAATKKSKILNELWGNISKPVQYSSIGGYVVVVSEKELDKAIDNEYSLQTNSEKKLSFILDSNEPIVKEERSSNQLSLFGLDTQNQEQLEFHVNTLGVINKFLENIGIEQRLVPQLLSEEGNIVEGAIAAAKFMEGTIEWSEKERDEILNNSNISEEEKDIEIAKYWSKLPEEAAHWWYRLLDTNSELKKALLTASLTGRKEKELRNSLYGDVYGDGVKVIGKIDLETGLPSLSPIREEAIGQLVAEAIKRIETKSGSPDDYSFLKKFLEWINSILDIFRTTNQDPFEVAAMKILSSDMSDLMTWEEYRELNNIVNFADVLTEQSVAPINYTILEDIGVPVFDEYSDTHSFLITGDRTKYGDSIFVNTKEELDKKVYERFGILHDQRQESIIQEVKDNQIFFDRLLNKSFRKKSKFLPKTLRKYFQIIDSQNLNNFKEWNIELQNITKKLSENEKRQIVETNGYTNIAPTLKVLPDLLKKYKKNPIVLSEDIKIDGAKKQDLSILNGIKEMIKLENPSLKSITSEEFVNEAHNWLQTNYLLGFANETGMNGEIRSGHPSYNVPNTFVHYDKNKNILNKDLENYRNLTEEQVRNLSPEERQTYLDIAGLGNRDYDIYHNKISIRFNDFSHFAKNLEHPHFKRRDDDGEYIIPSAWGNLTYFYTGNTKWKDAVLLHEIQNDNIEFLRKYKVEKIDLETSLGRYLQNLNEDLLNNITQIESGGKRIMKFEATNPSKQHSKLNEQLVNLVKLPLHNGYITLKEHLAEQIELNRGTLSLDDVKANLTKLYSQKRKFINFQKRGGIKSLLSSSELTELKQVLEYLNLDVQYNERTGENEQVQGDLSKKKFEFNIKTQKLQSKINSKVKEIYGEDFPFINIEAPAKALPKSQRRLTGRGGVVRLAGASNMLNENVNFLIMFSEKKISKNISESIENTKKTFIHVRNATMSNNFNVSLSKITQEQYANLIENYKYNQDLLNKLIDKQSQKDIQKDSVDVSKLSDEEIEKDLIGAYEEPNEIDQFSGRGFIYKNMYLSLNATTKEKAIQEIRDRNNKEKQLKKQQETFETIKQRALDKKIELEKDYGKVEDEVKKTLEIEMNYFTPLIHHIIQKHIKQYGKDFPMYFSGFNITMLSQHSARTALIYAGKEEINTVDRNVFKFNEGEYTTNKEIKDIEGFDNSKDQYFKNDVEITQQEYDKAYQQATEYRAKEIKYQAAKNLGLIKVKGTVPFYAEDEVVSLEEGIKRLNDFKKESDENMGRVIREILTISGNKPIETGAIFNAMSQVSGVKLVWQDNVQGIQPTQTSGLVQTTGGYLVDLSDYHYTTPILYALKDKKTENAISPSKNVDIENLNLTKELLDYLYNNSSKRLSKSIFAKESSRIITSLQSIRTNQEIIELLKCL